MVTGIAPVPKRAGGYDLSVCLPWLLNQQCLNHSQMVYDFTSTKKWEAFLCPFSLPRSPLKNEVPLQRGRHSVGGLIASGWFMLEFSHCLCRLCCMAYIYLTFLWIDNPMVAHRKKCILHVERWHLDELQEFWCFFEFDPLSLHWPPYFLAQHILDWWEGAGVLRVIYDLDSEVPYHFNGESDLGHSGSKRASGGAQCHYELVYSMRFINEGHLVGKRVLWSVREIKALRAHVLWLYRG